MHRVTSSSDYSRTRYVRVGVDPSDDIIPNSHVVRHIEAGSTCKVVRLTLRARNDVGGPFAVDLRNG